VAFSDARLPATDRRPVDPRPVRLRRRDVHGRSEHGRLAAAFENLSLFAVLAVLAVGSAFSAIFFLTGVSAWKTAGGWVLLASSWLATYTALAMMLEGAAGRVILPLGHLSKDANIPGRHEHIPLQFELGEPGVRRGQ
jgi:uncharacterized protein